MKLFPVHARFFYSALAIFMVSQSEGMANALKVEQEEKPAKVQFPTVTVPSLVDANATVEFRYFTHPTENFNPLKFTIVNMPGGPGAASTFDRTVMDLKKQNPDVQIVMIDPRGTGINLKLGEEAPHNLSSAGTVNDTVAVIQKLKLANYAVWGTSYGTVTATMLAHKIENTPGMVAPFALILEGILGKAYAYTPYYFENLDLRIRDFYSLLPQESVDLIARLRPLYKSQAAFNEDLALFFSYSVYAKTHAERIENLNRNLRSTIEDMENPPPPPIIGDDNFDWFNPKTYDDLDDRMKAGYLNDWIRCKEIHFLEKPSDDAVYRENTKTSDYLYSPCAPQVGWHGGLYDSKNYQITKTPIIYLQGFIDIQTPMVSALYHRFGQENLAAGSSFSLIMTGHHGVFHDNFDACFRPFVQDVGSRDFALTGMHACARENKVEIKPY